MGCASLAKKHCRRQCELWNLAQILSLSVFESYLKP